MRWYKRMKKNNVVADFYGSKFYWSMGNGQLGMPKIRNKNTIIKIAHIYAIQKSQGKRYGENMNE